MVEPTTAMSAAAAVAAVANSNAAAKLVETVSAALGKAMSPYHRRRDARAEADALVILAEGRVAAQEIEHRALERLLDTEVRRQENIEAIVEKARIALPDAVTAEPVSSDWSARFFDVCQDVGDDEMRSLWGKILAGEVTKPGSYSLRTLRALQHLAKDEAQDFEVICAGSFKQRDGLQPMIFDMTPESLHAAGLMPYHRLRTLEEAGLISLVALVQRPNEKAERGVCFDLGSLGYMWVKPPPPLLSGIAAEKFGPLPYSAEVSLGNVQLSPVGNQLAHLTKWEPTQARLDAARASLESSRHEVTIVSR